MNTYIIEHVIIVLLDITNNGKQGVGSFNVDGLSFEYWEYQEGKGLIGNKWLVKTEIESESHFEAIKFYYKKLAKIIPKISLIGQVYIDSQRGSLLIKKGNYGFLRYIFRDNPVGLYFGEKQQNILFDLIKNKNIPESFYFYWNELVNTSGYLAKILIISAALDSLFEKNKRKDGRITILGEKLANDLYESGQKGLRHRLTHGEYFSPEDFQKNYVEEVHKKVIKYFNNQIISIDEKISLDITNPQRHMYENYTQGKIFLEFKEEVNLKKILSEIENNDVSTLKYQTRISQPKDF